MAMDLGSSCTASSRTTLGCETSFKAPAQRVHGTYTYMVAPCMATQDKNMRTMYSQAIRRPHVYTSLTLWWNSEEGVWKTAAYNAHKVKGVQAPYVGSVCNRSARSADIVDRMLLIRMLLIE